MKMYSQVFRDINQVVGDNNEFLGEVSDHLHSLLLLLMCEWSNYCSGHNEENKFCTDQPYTTILLKNYHYQFHLP